VTGPARARGGRAFTLVELLLALAVVGVLLALLVPGLGLALDAVDALRCGNQLRQIGTAYQAYLGDSGGVWPPMLASERPEAVLRDIREATGLAAAPARPAEGWGQPGPHWSLVLWPYLGELSLFTCPADPKAGLRGPEVYAPGREHSIALVGAPPESYALNVVLFRTADDLRRQVKCEWGIEGDVDFNGLHHYTTVAEQRRLFPGLGRRILMVCGTSGLTVGSQYNMAFRTEGPVERWEWHMGRASEAFADEPGCGSNYLYVDGRVEYHDALPDLRAWGYRLE